MRRFLALIVFAPVAIVAVTLAVANRHAVTVTLDPFNSENPALGFAAPLFLVIFASIAFGVLLGGVSSWFGQGYWRAEAREKRREARRWRHEAGRLRVAIDENDTAALPKPAVY